VRGVALDRVHKLRTGQSVQSANANAMLIVSCPCGVRVGVHRMLVFPCGHVAVCLCQSILTVSRS
jgi:hypothetical protein